MYCNKIDLTYRYNGWTGRKAESERNSYCACHNREQNIAKSIEAKTRKDPVMLLLGVLQIIPRWFDVSLNAIDFRSVFDHRCRLDPLIFKNFANNKNSI